MIFEKNASLGLNKSHDSTTSSNPANLPRWGQSRKLKIFTIISEFSKVQFKSNANCNIKYLFVEVKNECSKLLLGCTYRPNRNIDMTDYLDFIENISYLMTKLLLLGTLTAML